jgi:flagellar motor protein MotB
MSTSLTSPPSLLGDEASRLLDEFAISEATELAREGAYDRAESLLRPLVERPDSPISSLDLFARVCAQQGRLGEAARWWQKVLDRDPGNASAQAALTRANAMQRRPVWLQTVWPMLVGVAVLLCITLVLTWQSRRQNAANAQLQQQLTELAKAEAATGRQQVESVLAQVEAISTGQAKAEKMLAALANFNGKLDSWAQAQETQAQASSNQVQAFTRDFAMAKADFEQRLNALQADNTRLAAQQDAATQGLSNQVAALRSSVDREKMLAAEIKERQTAAEKLQADYRALEIHRDTLARKLEVVVRPPSVSINVPGVTTSVSGNEIVVGFEGGLFDHGTYFKLGTKERLLAVAKILSQSPEPLRIHLVGFGDDDRAFLKWTAQWESSLSLERATSVANYIVQLGLIQPANITVAGSTAEIRPYASDSARNRARNRTVVLRVSPAKSTQTN